jgi:hypothetical protein
MDAIRSHPTFPDVADVKIPPNQEIAFAYQPDEHRWVIMAKDSRLQIHPHVVVLAESAVALLFHAALTRQLAPMLAAMGQSAAAPTDVIAGRPH